MAFLKVKNRAVSSLASGVSDSDTSWTLATGEGALFPTAGDFHVTCENEIVKCTSRSTDVLTVTRAQEGTAAAAHASGKAVELRITAELAEQMQSPRTATLVVAASDASAVSQAQADYLCDGTADDVQIQAAVDAIPATGGKVSLTEGIFYISSAIQIPEKDGSDRTYITLCGQGMSTRLVPDGDLTDNFIESATATDRTIDTIIQDLTIDGDVGGGNVQSSGHGIYLWAPSYSRILNVTIMDCAAQGIRIDGDATWTSIDLVIRGCKVSSNGGHGIYAQANQSDITISDCNIYYNGGSGVYLLSGGNIISNNRIYTNTALGVVSSGYYNQIVGNNIADNGSWGVQADNLENVIVGNVFKNNGDRGVRLGGAGDRTLIVANSFMDNTSGPIVIASGCEDALILGNEFADTGLLDVGTNTMIRNNRGYVTENSGTSSITSGTTTKVVAHSLAQAPTVINISFREQGTADYGRWWISGIDATDFTLNVSTNPGASNLDFGWEAKVR